MDKSTLLTLIQEFSEIKGLSLFGRIVEWIRVNKRIDTYAYTKWIKNISQLVLCGQISKILFLAPPYYFLHPLLDLREVKSIKS